MWSARLGLVCVRVKTAPAHLHDCKAERSDKRDVSLN